MEPLLLWQCYEHVHEQRTRDWYWALGIIALAGAVASIVMSNVLFALIIILAALIWGLLSSQPPEITTIGIYERGLRIGEQLYPWSDVRSYWVDDEAEENQLLIDTKRMLSPNLVIALGELDPEVVRSTMERFAQEEYLHESLPHRLFQLLGL